MCSKLEKKLNIDNVDNRIIKIIKEKQSADKFVKSAHYVEAINKYEYILQIINDRDDNNNKYCRSLKYGCLNNQSSAYFSCKQYSKCIHVCNQIINNYYSHCNTEYKAYIKRAASYLSLWKTDRNNRQYLINCFNDYNKAAQYDQIYQSYARKFQKLLTQSSII